MKPREIVVSMRTSTAIIHWQIMETFATLPGLPPIGRQRAHELAGQYHKLSRGDIANGAALSEGQDAICASVLDGRQPGPALCYSVEFLDRGGSLLDDGRPAVLSGDTPWAVLIAGMAKARPLPAGLIAWFREAGAGDRATFYNAAEGARYYAKVTAADSAAADDGRD